MPKQKKVKRTRITLDLEVEDFGLLNELSVGNNSKARFLRKAIRILDQLNKEEVFLTNSEGSRIPKSVIFA